jgi:hypothetical protein
MQYEEILIATLLFTWNKKKYGTVKQKTKINFLIKKKMKKGPNPDQWLDFKGL